MAVKGPLIGFTLVVLLAAISHSTNSHPVQDGATQGAYAAQPSSTTPVVPAAAPTPIPVPEPVITWGDPVQVAKIIDGDTFETTTGQRIRALGIDSCEMSTPGGQAAKAYAQTLLSSGRIIVLVREPTAPDTDRYGRLLRYVRDITGTSDFGWSMVVNDHTGAYAGRNDASPEYVAKMRELDTDGRTCGDEPPPPPPPAEDDNTYVPAPSNDDNHKSRYCRRHWYC